MKSELKNKRSQVQGKKKLVLSTETVRRLQSDELRDVRGGRIVLSFITDCCPTNSCPNTSCGPGVTYIC